MHQVLHIGRACIPSILSDNFTSMIHYAICFVMRSGSNWLCDMLSNAGVGVPSEYYFPLDFDERTSRRRLPSNPKFNPRAATPAEYWRNIEKSQGDVVGLKLGWQAFEKMREEVDVSALELQHIYLTRRDKLRQAISWYRAGHTKRWTTFNDRQVSDPPYDEAEIAKHLGYIDSQEASWECYLSGKPHLQIEYEDIGIHTVYEIADYIGAKVVREPQTSHKPIRDELTESFVEQYQSTNR